MLGSLKAIVGVIGVGVIAIIKKVGSLMIWPSMRFLPQLPASDYESAYPIASFHMTIWTSLSLLLSSKTPKPSFEMAPNIKLPALSDWLWYGPSVRKCHNPWARGLHTFILFRGPLATLQLLNPLDVISWWPLALIRSDVLCLCFLSFDLLPLVGNFQSQMATSQRGSF